MKRTRLKIGRDFRITRIGPGDWRVDIGNGKPWPDDKTLLRDGGPARSWPADGIVKALWLEILRLRKRLGVRV
jgi:hypothetical protein